MTAPVRDPRWDRTFGVRVSHRMPIDDGASARSPSARAPVHRVLDL